MIPSFLILPKNRVALVKGQQRTTSAPLSNPAGRGSFGVVYRGKLKVVNNVELQHIAVKSLQDLVIPGEQEYQKRKQVSDLSCT